MGKSNFNIISINVGKPQKLNHRGEQIWTGIQKEPISKPIFLSKLNFDGDGQADTIHHGGFDKAVCVYSFEHYLYWEKELNITLDLGAFGENLTIEGLTENMVHIGDIFQMGEAIVQVSQPRQPCHKLAKRYNLKDLPVRFQNTGFTGFYFRVLKEGIVEKNTRCSLIEADRLAISIEFANQIMHHEKDNQEAIKQILKVNALSDSWRQTFEKRLKGSEMD